MQDVLAYLSEDDARRNVFSEEELIWELNHVTYGSFQEGPTGDSTWTLTKEFSASDVSASGESAMSVSGACGESDVCQWCQWGVCHKCQWYIWRSL